MLALPEAVPVVVCVVQALLSRGIGGMAEPVNCLEGNCMLRHRADLWEFCDNVGRPLVAIPKR